MRKRKEQGKKVITLAEDFRLVTPQKKTEKSGKVCFSPWKQIRIMPNGWIDMCTFRGDKAINILDFVNNNTVDWNKVFNGAFYKFHRKNFSKGRYTGCGKNCAASYSSLNYKFLEDVCK
jgi:hypothetical protein